MSIWLLTIVLLASLAGMGYRQGAIRVLFSLLGIVLGAWLAVPLGRLIKPLIAAMGLKDTLLLSIVPVLVVFLIILTLFKVVGLVVHRKTEVFYKYQAGDLRLVLWKRLNHRIGLCAGLLNGTAYLVLASTGIYTLSYWTYQMATPEASPKGVQILNRLGKDLQSTGLSAVAGAADRMPEAYYDSADIVGLVFHNPQLESRLSRYPAFFALSQRQELQELANDPSITNVLNGQGTVMDLLNHPRVKAMLGNQEMIKTISAAVVPNLKDLRKFLETGQSAKFNTDKIIGRWEFDVNGAVMLVKKTKPNMSAKEVAEARLMLMAFGSGIRFIAAPDGQTFLKMPEMRTGQNALVMQSTPGEWKNAGNDKYEITTPMNGRTETLTGEFQGERLTILSREAGRISMAFRREE